MGRDSKTLESKKVSFILKNESTESDVSLTLQNKNNYCIIKAKDDTIIGFKKFKATFSNDELCNIHKIFKMFETVDKSIDFLIKIFQNKNARIYSNEEGLILELIFYEREKKTKLI